MYVLLIGLHKKDRPRSVGVFDTVDFARAAAEQIYKQVYDKPATWINDSQIAHDPDKWSQYVFAAVVAFKVNTIHPDVEGEIEAVRDLRSRGMIE